MTERRGVDELARLGDGRQVFRLRGSGGANVYLLRDRLGQGWLLDSGFATDQARLLRRIGDVLGDSKRLKGILLTHYHKDHADGAAGLAAATGACIFCSADDARVFRRESPYIRLPRELTPGTERFLAASPMWERCFQGGDEWYPRIDETLTGGDEYAACRVLALPGHTPGCLGLYDETEGLLFSADYLVYPSEELPRFFRRFVDSVHVDPVGAEQATGRLLALDFDRLFPGHGRPLPAGARTALRCSTLYRQRMECCA